MDKRTDDIPCAAMQRICLLAPIDMVIYTEVINEEDDFDGAYTDFLDDEDYENTVDPRDYRW